MSENPNDCGREQFLIRMREEQGLMVCRGCNLAFDEDQLDDNLLCKECRNYETRKPSM